MELSAEKIIEIQFHEVDSLQIVWHGHYARYFELGREAFGQKHGFSYLDMKAHHVAVPVVHMNIEYKRSLKYGDSVRVVSTFVSTPAAKIIFDYKLYNHETDKLVAIGRTEQVFTDPVSGELLYTYPVFMNDWLDKLKSIL